MDRSIKLLPLLAAMLICANGLAQTPQPPESPAPAAQPTTFDSGLKLIGGLIRRDSHTVTMAALELANAQATEALTPRIARRFDALLPPLIPAQKRAQYLEKPDLFPVNPGHFTGEPIYYINGIATDNAAAQKEAEALANQVRRPVVLLYNATAIKGEDKLSRDIGMAQDIAHCVYERTWPFLPPPDDALLEQADRVTRQATWLLANTKGNLTIVSHSQGCLIMRNAILTASHLTNDNLPGRISWIATGVPLRDEEIFPKPGKLRVITNPTDPVPQTLGLRLDPEKITQQDLDSHNFIKQYVGQIQPSDL